LKKVVLGGRLGFCVAGRQLDWQKAGDCIEFLGQGSEWLGHGHGECGEGEEVMVFSLSFQN